MIYLVNRKFMDYKLAILVSFIMSITAGAIPDVSEFFPEIENDLSRVTWGHAINSKDLLEDAISNDSYMMLEADVSKGHLVDETAPSKLIPIMAHPPRKTSDISLEMWIDEVIEANKEGKKIGAKLDFKDLDIVITSLEILGKKSDSLSFPLWLNADILRGPGGEDKVPVDADIFLSLCMEFFPDATLSLGWTTEVISGTDQKYTYDMVEDMVDTLDKNNVNQPVTFPVRATFIGPSMDALENLYIDKPDYTFTVWTSPSDELNFDDLATFQASIGTNAVFFDLPEDQMEEFAKARDRLATSKARSNMQNNFLIFTLFCIVISVLGAQLFR